VPPAYVATRTARTHVWKRLGAPVEPCETIIDDVIGSVEGQLDFELGGDLQLVIYDSNAEARRALGRNVPSNMLLTPVQSATTSLVALQSVAANALNGDLDRMRRHLSHEFTHVAVALRTGSEKRLGDENRGLRVEPWLNEGFACVVSALICRRRDLLERATALAARAQVADLNAALDDLIDDKRAAAFALATARVWRTVQRQGLREVFATLGAPTPRAALAARGAHRPHP